MAAPTYQGEFSIGLLGTIGNLLSQPMSFYRCSTCAALVAEAATGTVSRDLHTAFHTTIDTATTKATQAASDASAAKQSASDAATAATTSKNSATNAATSAAGAQTSALNSSSAAARAATNASDATAAANSSATSASAAQAAVAQIIESTGMCPLCRAEVATEKITLHLTYHYRRAHGDPVEFPADFDPTTADLSEVDPPMRTNMTES